MALLFNGSYEEIRSSPTVHLNSPAVYGRRQLFARRSECAKEQSVAQVRWSRAVRGQWRGRRIYGAFHPTQSREDNHEDHDRGNDVELPAFKLLGFFLPSVLR